MKFLRTHILKVGRGDNIILELPNDQGMKLIGIIDCYIFDSTWQYLDQLDPEKVQFIIATHPHKDHILGMKKLLEKLKDKGIPIGMFFDSGYDKHPKKNYVELTEYFKDNFHEINPSFPKAGSEFHFGKVKLRILGPPAELIQGTRSDCNNASIVAHIRYGNARLLFAADAELPNWAHICAHQRRRMAAQVLKVSHHGSKWGTFFEALDVIKPRYAIISGNCSRHNSTGGFPHPLTIAALKENRRTKIYCTHDDGNIIIESNARGTHDVIKPPP